MDLKDSSFFQKVANSWFASRQRIAEMLCGNVLLMLKGHSSHKGPLGKNKGRGNRGQRLFAAQTAVKRFSPSSQVHLERIEKEIRWREWESWRKKKSLSWKFERERERKSVASKETEGERSGDAQKWGWGFTSPSVPFPVAPVIVRKTIQDCSRATKGLTSPLANDLGQAGLRFDTRSPFQNVLAMASVTSNPSLYSEIFARGPTLVCVCAVSPFGID